MTPEKWKLLYATYWEDVQHVSTEDFRAGCRRYRSNKANRFFPTPGMLLDACRNPYADEPRKYPALPAPDTELSPEERTLRLAGFKSLRTSLENRERDALRREAEARGPLVMTEALRERERQLSTERRAALERRMAQPERARG